MGEGEDDADVLRISASRDEESSEELEYIFSHFLIIDITNYGRDVNTTETCGFIDTIDDSDNVTSFSASFLDTTVANVFSSAAPTTLHYEE